MKEQNKNRLKLAIFFLFIFVIGVIAYPQGISKHSELRSTLDKLTINLGLDLQGGIHLEYKADVSNVPDDKKDEALEAAQDVIERRVNAFGVGEPLVQASFSGRENRIIVELPGVKDIEDAKKQIKETPFLEFREDKKDDEQTLEFINSLNEMTKNSAQEVLQKVLAGENFEELAKQYSMDPGSKENGGDLDFAKKGTYVEEFDKVVFKGGLEDNQVHPNLVESEFGYHIIKKLEEREVEVETVNDEGEVVKEMQKEVRVAHILIAKRTIEQFPEIRFATTGLNGENLERADVVFASQGMSDPQVSLTFDSEGVKKFAEITKNNIGKQVAIFLDGQVISAPTVQNEITNGQAVITGNFTLDEAKQLSKRLNEGALPIPLELVSQQSIEASLGQASLEKSLYAGLVGILLVMIFMIFYYRLLGVIAALAVMIYAGSLVTIFKLSGALSPWPITLTLSGIAGFILSVGMAVDANILIFERFKEELRGGRGVQSALKEGFKRAWPSIRDGNVSTILTSLILIWFGTGFVKGFAVILLLGVLVSMFTAIVLVKFILGQIAGKWLEKRKWLVARVKK